MTLHTKPTSANKADQHPTLTGWFTRLHNNDRGNLGILLLLTVWALLTSLIGMVWNTGEYATGRRNVHTAADAAAHAGNLWISRTTNVTTAANLVIAENGSAEAILRSVQPTHDTIQQRFDSEGKRAWQLQHGDTPNQPEQGIPDCEYFEELLGFGAWAGNGRGDKRVGDFGSLSPDVLQAVKWVLPFLDAPTQARLNDEVVDHLRRNGVALRWLNDTWVAGMIRESSEFRRRRAAGCAPPLALDHRSGPAPSCGHPPNPSERAIVTRPMGQPDRSCRQRPYA